MRSDYPWRVIAFNIHLNVRRRVVGLLPEGNGIVTLDLQAKGEQQMPASMQDFKEAMGRFPSGVTIVTTVDQDGRSWGFTATAFSSLSIDPPLILACLAGKAECKAAFMSATQFAVSILRPEHKDLAIRFATKGIDKFAGGEFSTGNIGVPVLTDAVVTIECTMEAKYPGGDHVILVGAVEHIKIQKGEATIYHGGKFHTLARADDPRAAS